MGQAAPPRVEGVASLADGRKIGFAEYGVPEGRAVLWFHGTPGARRQVPEAARVAATERGMRLIALERPGVGASTPHLYDRIVDWSTDVDEVADRLGVDRFGLIGLSGGGPYVLACAHQFPDRVASGAIMGGVAPTRGDDAVPGGLVDLTRRFAPAIRAIHKPLSRTLWTTVRVIGPFSSQAFELYARISPEGDRRVFRVPGMKEMFIDDLLRGSRAAFSAPANDIVLFGRHWGFQLGDIKVPIHFWQGGADYIVPVEHGHHLAAIVPNSELRVRDDDGHLGNLDAGDEVLDAIDADW